MLTTKWWPRNHEPAWRRNLGRNSLCDQQRPKIRPAVVVQCDRLNQKLISTVVAAVTTNLQHLAREPSQFLIDPKTPEGQSSKLLQPSAVKCENLFTVSQIRIKRTLGHLSDVLKRKLNDCLKSALAVT